MPEMPEQFRMFVSLPVDAAVKEEIRRLQNELRAQLPGDAVRWTRPDNIHLTLKFLGNVAVEQVDALASVLREACAGFEPLALRAENLGFFPPRGLPRVLWVSVRDERDQLAQLQRNVETGIRQKISGIEEERFTGHLTIGRVRNLRHTHARKLSDFARQFNGKVLGDWRAEKLELMRSELAPEGSGYSCLSEIPLSGKSQPE